MSNPHREPPPLEYPRHPTNYVLRVEPDGRRTITPPLSAVERPGEPDQPPELRIIPRSTSPAAMPVTWAPPRAAYGVWVWEEFAGHTSIAAVDRDGSTIRKVISPSDLVSEADVEEAKDFLRRHERRVSLAPVPD